MRMIELNFIVKRIWNYTLVILIFIEKTKKVLLLWDLYGRLGIARGENAKMKAQHRRNFQFFDAPVGIVFTIDRRLATGSWLDYGMFLQNVMTAARVRGLDTCAQAAWTHYHKAIRPVLELDDTETVVCGMALGFADPDAPENAMVTERTPATTFARFQGFA
jgi:nitroreductase